MRFIQHIGLLVLAQLGTLKLLSTRCVLTTRITRIRRHMSMTPTMIVRSSSTNAEGKKTHDYDDYDDYDAEGEEDEGDQEDEGEEDEEDEADEEDE